MSKITTESKSLFAPSDITSNDFQNRIFNKFGGYRKFWKKVGIFLKVTTGDSCRFTLERFGRRFITLHIREPCEYYKGIELEELASFFGVDLAERSEAGGEHRSPSLDYSAGGGG